MYIPLYIETHTHTHTHFINPILIHRRVYRKHLRKYRLLKANYLKKMLNQGIYTIYVGGVI